MIETKLLLTDIEKEIDLLPDNETKFKLESLLLYLSNEIEVQQQFIEGTTDFLMNTKQLEKAKEHAIIHAGNKLWENVKNERLKFENRGIKAPNGYASTFELDMLFDGMKFNIEN